MEKLTIITTLFGGTFTFLLGTWTPFMTILLVLIAIDLLTGFLKGFVLKNLRSRKMMEGSIRKLSIFIMIIVANMMDIVLFQGMGVIAGACITYYLSMEIISILENLGEIGLPLPPVVRDHLELLKKRSGKKNENDPQ